MGTSIRPVSNEKKLGNLYILENRIKELDVTIDCARGVVQKMDFTHAQNRLLHSFEVTKLKKLNDGETDISTKLSKSVQGLKTIRLQRDKQEKKLNESEKSASVITEYLTQKSSFEKELSELNQKLLTLDKELLNEKNLASDKRRISIFIDLNKETIEVRGSEIKKALKKALKDLSKEYLDKFKTDPEGLLKTLKQNVLDATSSIDKLMQERDKLLASVTDLQAKKENAKREIERSKTALEKAKTALEESENDIERFDSAFNALAREWNDKKSELEKRKGELESEVASAADKKDNKSERRSIEKIDKLFAHLFNLLNSGSIA